MGVLRERMRREMVVRKLSPRTQESYITAVVGLTRYYRRSPDRITDSDVRDYVVYLLEERKLAWGSVNVALAGIRFLLIHTLHRNVEKFRIPTPKRTGRLPQILSCEEVGRILEALENVKHRTLLMTTYAAGLRVRELTHLQVRDIDSDRMTLRIVQGKGAKDRYVGLSPRLLDQLRLYWQAERPQSWLFPSPHRGHPLNATTPQRVYHKARSRAGVTKEGWEPNSSPSLCATRLQAITYSLAVLSFLPPVPRQLRGQGISRSFSYARGLATLLCPRSVEHGARTTQDRDRE